MLKVGFDYSMTSPAMTIISDDGVQQYCFGKPKQQGRYQSGDVTITVMGQNPHTNNTQRFYELAARFSDILGQFDILGGVFNIEGYAYQGHNLADIGENTGCLKTILYLDHKIILDVIQPSTIKKKATGNGSAKKLQMIEAAEQLLGVNYCDLLNIKPEKKEGNPISDLADSYHIASFER